MHVMHMYVYFLYPLRPVVRLADIYTPAQTSSPQTSAHMLHVFLVLCRHPNRRHVQQKVRLTVVNVDFFYAQQAGYIYIYIIIFIIIIFLYFSFMFFVPLWQIWTLKKTYIPLKGRATCESAPSSVTLPA